MPISSNRRFPRQPMMAEDEQLTDLRARYPDLADKVVEDELTLR